MSGPPDNRSRPSKNNSWLRDDHNRRVFEETRGEAASLGANTGTRFCEESLVFDQHVSGSNSPIRHQKPLNSSALR